MKNNGSKISDFLSLYYTLENSTSFERYMYRTRLSFCICLELAMSQYLDNPTSFEKMCSSIPRNFGSRASIQNILNLGLNDNFLTKVQSKEDKRVQLIKINDEFLIYIETWIKMHTGVFDPAIKLKKQVFS
ncbi:hypothetical protein N9R78_00160 [Pelagibacteraceae bacterium]|nr:hypothetical protein [Pelagibacteraceae bacterium]